MREVLSVIVLAAMSLSGVDAQRDSSVPPHRDLLGKQFAGTITRVADGDSLEATAVGDSRTLRLRLQGIDAPELGEVFSREAQAHLRTLVSGKSVRISVADIDRYGRLVARVNVAGTDASVALVRAGLACHAYAADATLEREEEQARAGGAGFWAKTAKKPACVMETSLSSRRSAGARTPATTARPAAPPPQSPDTSRPQTIAPPKVQYRGNVSSGLYHSSTCANFRCRNCTRLFANAAEAKAAGFRPAGDCAQ